MLSERAKDNFAGTMTILVLLGVVAWAVVSLLSTVEGTRLLGAGIGFLVVFVLTAIASKEQR